MDISCTICDRPYPESGLPFLCPQCGGLFDLKNPIQFNPNLVDRSKPGIWRYEHTFELPPDSMPVSLGEGNTPLVWTEIYGRKVAVKSEYQNPSGSFKDRGSTVMTTWLQSRNVHEAIEDSSGNAGASFAAYAARAGIKARIFVPESAGGSKRRQIQAYGAELISVPGNRKDASDAAMASAGEGNAYASHTYLPFNIPGYATTAYEIFEQLGNIMPGALILPAGQGGLLLGIARGFEALRIAINYVKRKTTIIGVQAHACAPLWEMYAHGYNTADPVTENQTLAEGVRVPNPVRAEAVLQAVLASEGKICIVEENEILPCRETLGKLGFYVEPTSAIVLSALENTVQYLPDPIVVILTGSGYKYQQ